MMETKKTRTLKNTSRASARRPYAQLRNLSTTSKVAGKLSFGALARRVPRAVVEEEIEKAVRWHKGQSDSARGAIRKG
jgi:hypothetical protein